MLKKIICTISALIMAGAALAACSTKTSSVTSAIEAPEVTGELKTTVLDVGKADAIIIETENGAVVIDTGEKNDGDEVLEYLAEQGINNVNYLIITHFDKDHVGGAAEVINGIPIGGVISPDYEGTNKEYEKFVKAIEETGVSETRLTEYMTFTLDDAVFEVYPPQKSSYVEEDNDFSIVINVTHGAKTFMFAGDCETERLSELPKQMNMEHMFLKVPHHGRYCAGVDEFIESVNPVYAIITDSEKNPADEEVLALLEGVGCETYETIYGSVTVVSDGTAITVTQ